MRTPQALKLGDEIRLVAPSRWVDESLVRYAENAIRARGFKVSRAANLLGREGQLAGTDAQRADALISSWNDEEVKAIWALRGGYGAQRLLETLKEGLDTDLLKWFIGFSDSTAIHGLLSNLDLASLHAPMWSTIPNTADSHIEATFNVLSGRMEDLSFETHPFDIRGEVSGRLVGGNLSVLQTMIGTSSFPIHERDILFIEDLDEMLYHVDRMLLHLGRSGELAKLSGIIVGGMSDMRDNTITHGFTSDNPFGKGVDEILREHLTKLDIPIAFDFPAGHGKDNYPIVLGAQVKLEVSGDVNRLSFSPA